MKKNILTIGGGVAGIEASNILAGIGYSVSIVEKEAVLGGKINQWHKLFPDFRDTSDIQEYLNKQVKKPDIMVFTNTEITSVKKTDNGFYAKSNRAVGFDAHAILLATGFDIFNAEKKEEYGYTIYDNVITSVDLEVLFKKGRVIHTASGKTPQRIAFIHCVGSRDAKVGNHYCSKVCCVTGVKQAIELSRMLPETEIYCFYMDLRMFGLDFEELYKSAQEKHHIQFIRGRLSEASENIDNSILIKCEDTLSGRPLKMNVDLVILLVGMEAGIGTHAAGEICKLNFQKSNFISCNDIHLGRNCSSREGIFLAGTCTGPMSIPETLDNARAAALEIDKFLSKN
jgi:heterodisulfide reductase subunit A